MNINSPKPNQLLQLRNLWKEAFGDSDAFLDVFFSTAFDSSRCRCLTIDNKVVAALYWFRCEYKHESIAYIYAVATAKSHRGQGLCHQLMTHTHLHLTSIGYEGVLLVPGSKQLYDFYQKMGYQTCCYHNEFTTSYSDSTHIDDLTSQESNTLRAAELPTIQEVDVKDYARLRRQYLPSYGVIQEQENLDFLQTQAKFYQGSDFLLAARVENESLTGMELLGNTDSADMILSILKCKTGTFRTIGNDAPFGMYYALGSSTLLPPSYFGFAFD